MSIEKLLHRFALAFALIAVAGSVASAAPKIQFESETVDFGNAVSGNSVTVSFKLTNAGDADLTITEVKPGCGCTRAAAKENKLAPGKSTIVEAELDTKGYEGRVAKVIYVHSDDPARPLVVLHMVGDIITLAKLNPPRINFGTIKVNTTRTHTLRVLPGDPKTFAITKVESKSTQVSVSGFKKIADKAGAYWELTVVVKAGGSAGRVYETLSIFTNAGPNALLYPVVYGNVSD